MVIIRIVQEIWKVPFLFFDLFDIHRAREQPKEPLESTQ
jgi:hypothetical protein